MGGYWRTHIDYHGFPQTGPVKSVDEMLEITHVGRIRDPRVVIVEVPLILWVTGNLLVERETGPEREIERGMRVVRGIVWPFLMCFSHDPGRGSHDSTRPVYLVMEVGIRRKKRRCCGVGDLLGGWLSEESTCHGHPYHAL